MQVILLTDVDKVGLRGDVVNVAPGYARNFLLPRRLAQPATPARIAELARRDEQRARHEARTLEQGQQIADLLGKTVLRFDVKAGPTGALFGSITPTDIADEIWRTRKVRVDRRKIDLGEPLRRVGRYEVPIEVFSDVRVEVKTLVVPEGGELPPEDETATDEVSMDATVDEAPGGGESEATAEAGGPPPPAEPELSVSEAEAASVAPGERT